MSLPFRFKQFNVIQDRAAMKLGTDGVLLGAWAYHNNPSTILDIGTGTGVIALQLAQRFSMAKIEAIDIDKDAFQEASMNFKNSKWSDRLTCSHVELSGFIEERNECFDLIVCNPPFYNNTYQPKDKKRAMARHMNSLPYQRLLSAIQELLSNDGSAAFIIPFHTQEVFLKIARENHLFPMKITNVKGNKEAKYKRSLISLSNKKQLECIPVTLVLEVKRHEYTEAYSHLVSPFYI